MISGAAEPVAVMLRVPMDKGRTDGASIYAKVTPSLKAVWADPMSSSDQVPRFSGPRTLSAEKSKQSTMGKT